MASIFIINDMTPEEKKVYDREYAKKHYKRKTIDKGLPPVKSGNYWKEYLKQKRQNDPNFRLKSNIGNRIREVFRKNKSYKNNSTLEILGCTLDEFKQHIESQFKPWMTWDNYGCKVPSGPDVTWDLDHIIPVSSAINEDDIKRLNHYTNFQPLCSFQNRFIKRDNVV
jgi:hypothetical protein